jgi:hypothetical protein
MRHESICTMSIAPFGDELLEHDAVLAHLAGRDLDRSDRFADLAVPGNVVRAGRLLDEEGLGKGELLHPVDRLADFPDLVRVDHQVPVGADHFAGDGQPADIVVEVTADLHLHVVEACIDRLLRTAGRSFSSS